MTKIKVNLLEISLFLNLSLIVILIASMVGNTVPKEEPLDKLEGFEMLLDSPKYCAFSKCIHENMTWAQIRGIYKSFKGYSSYNEHALIALTEQVCRI